MQSTYLYYPQPELPRIFVYGLWVALFAATFYLDQQINTKVALLFFVCVVIIAYAIKHYVYGQNLGFTLTATHFQQHLYKGGWVLQWHNIRSINTLEYDFHGWQTSIPWVGIAIKDYQAFLQQISPKVMTQMLLHQRNLLYLGLKQHGRQAEFEDLLIKDTPFYFPDGTQVKGLQAMFANRMAVQKQLWGYDLFISEGDIVGKKSDFVGLARRYLAASHS
ncbi:MAG: DUF2982 domain-containing protein [Vibrio sp.]